MKLLTTSVLMSYEAEDGEHHLDSHFLVHHKALAHLQGKEGEECGTAWTFMLLNCFC